MSQAILQVGYAESIRKAANNAALLKVVSDLVAAKKGLNHGDKRLGRKSNIYQHAVELLQATGVVITKDALQQRVARALKAEQNPDKVEQVIISIPSSESEISSLTTPDIENSPLTGNPPQFAGHGGRRKGSMKAQSRSTLQKNY